MSLSQFSQFEPLLASEMNEIVDHLQGASGKTDAWHFRSSSGNNFLITLSDNAGARKFSIRDSDGNEIFSVDSDGALTATSTSFTNLDIPTSASPSQTAEGRVVWDSDDDVLTIGDGSARKTFGYLGTTVALDGGTAAAGTSNEASRVDHVHPSSTLDISATAQEFVEGGVYKGFAALGSPTGGHTFATGDAVGTGFAVLESSSGAVGNGSSAAQLGGWYFDTSTTGASNAGVIGPRAIYTNDNTFVARVSLVQSSANQNAFWGFQSSSSSFADANNCIGFRVTDTGNVFGVCDSGGTETTRDCGFLPTTEATYRIEIRDSGTVVRFYVNGVQVGADVTTNIPTGGLYTALGIINSTTVSRVMLVFDAFVWREVAP